jgi:hypothetical protein
MGLMKSKIKQPVAVEDKANGLCCWVGCEKHGAHPAPKSPRNLREKYHFCLAHVRQYNKSWNFFNGMSDNEAEAFRSDSVTGHRPTSKMGINYAYCHPDDIKEQVFREFNFTGSARAEEKKIPDNEKKALEVIGLRHPVTMQDIKRKYKELAKRYHPDVNGHKDEERLKVINQAYSFLKTSGFYK